jgi:hypothetical protein
MERLGHLSAYVFENPSSEFFLTLDELDVIVNGLPSIARHSAEWWREGVGSQWEPFIESISHYVPTLDAANQRVSFVHVDSSKADAFSVKPPDKSQERHVMVIDIVPPGPGETFVASSLNQKRIGLVAGGHQRELGPRLARDLYDSRIFRERRQFVEQTCDEWWILSGVHGLASPRDTLSSGDVSLSKVRRSVRRFWAEQVWLTMFYRITPDAATTFELHASHHYADSGLIQGIERLGARVERPAFGLTLSDQYDFYGTGVVKK